MKKGMEKKQRAGENFNTEVTSINKSRLIRYMGSIKKTEYEGNVKQAIGIQLNL